MTQQLKNGLVDYLEILRMSGISEVARLKPLPQQFTSTQPLPQQVKPADVPPRKTLQEVILETKVPPQENVSKNKNNDTGESDLRKKLLSIVSPSEPLTKKEKILLLAKEVAKCTRCSELALTRIQTVFGQGNPDSRLVFIGEAPGADEDEQGIPFVGRSGQLLNDIITKGMKISRDEIYICNILRCRPPKNRNPLPDEAEHCRPFLDATLEIIKPEYICCLGAVAAKNLLHIDTAIGQLRGKVLEYNASFGTVKVICTYHPSYLLRNPAAKKDTWEDIKLLMNEMGMV
ncbi:uracil-DNA glycosylase [Planctomycetales bacterium]|nr:uracil-DNA glycosylase [Planctomycetales bacterium]GHT36603.1 uracil-DNA glycosylase [Planctomycetales bacterium]